MRMFKTKFKENRDPEIGVSEELKEAKEILKKL